MANNISQSLQNKSRKDKFLLSLTVPNVLKDISSENSRLTHQKSWMRVMPDTLQYSVFGAVVPAVSIPAVDIPKYGQTMKVSSHTRAAYDDVSVDFTIDNEFNNYWYIWRWLEVLNDSKYSEYDYHNTGDARSSIAYEGTGGTTSTSTTRTTIPGTDGPQLILDYVTDISLFPLDEYNNKIAEFTYIKAFPVSLGEISYNYRDEGEIESTFSFAFSQLLVKLL